MKKLSILFVIILLWGCSGCPCKDCCKEPKPCSDCPSFCIPPSNTLIENREFLNINILLDLSDRIFDNNQKKRDIKIIELIYDNLTTIITQSGFSNSGLSKAKDKFKIHIASQDETDFFKSKYESTLNIDYEIIRKSDKASKKSERRKNLIHSINSLYTEKFKTSGSDFSEWLYNMAKIGPEPNYKNILIIITDGESDNFKSKIDEVSLEKFEIKIIEISNDGGDVNNLIEKENRIKEYFRTLKSIPQLLPNELSPEQIVIEMFKGISNIPPPIENIDLLKKKDDLNEIKIIESKTVNPNWLNKIFTELDIKLQNTTILCEQTEYTNLKIKISGYKGQEITNDQIQQFKAEINDVPNKCRKTN